MANYSIVYFTRSASQKDYQDWYDFCRRWTIRCIQITPPDLPYPFKKRQLGIRGNLKFIANSNANFAALQPTISFVRFEILKDPTPKEQEELSAFFDQYVKFIRGKRGTYVQRVHQAPPLPSKAAEDDAYYAEVSQAAKECSIWEKTVYLPLVNNIIERLYNILRIHYARAIEQLLKIDEKIQMMLNAEDEEFAEHFRRKLFTVCKTYITTATENITTNAERTYHIYCERTMDFAAFNPLFAQYYKSTAEKTVAQWRDSLETYLRNLCEQNNNMLLFNKPEEMLKELGLQEYLREQHISTVLVKQPSAKKPRIVH